MHGYVRKNLTFDEISVTITIPATRSRRGNSSLTRIREERSGRPRNRYCKERRWRGPARIQSVWGLSRRRRSSPLEKKGWMMLLSRGMVVLPILGCLRLRKRASWLVNEGGRGLARFAHVPRREATDWETALITRSIKSIVSLA